ncbi:MAG: LacI family DNA-binding transcriptional regulator [Phycisphaerales bacterium]|nr:MAG: LacI family DNA-binding transcriptional regulator [Phycisphaerales bacterium]
MRRGPRPTLKAIAKQLGVSVTTVSRALNGKAEIYGISKKTEEAVLRAAKKLRFSPDPVARGLRLNQTLSIGLLIPDIANPYFAEIAKNVEMAARRAAYSVILCDSQESTDLEVESLALLRGRKVDGLVIAPVGQSARHLEELQDGGLPVVVIDRHFPRLKLPYVVSDNYKGALDATNHLIERGHRTIACVQGLARTSPNRDRVRGYQASLKKHGIAADASLVVGSGFGEENGYVHAKLLLTKKRGITAILALSNLIALGILRALSEDGLKVPGDISIICFDDQPYCAYLNTPMTTVDQDNEQMGQIAVRLLLEQIQSPGKPGGEGIMLPTRLIERASVKRLTR